MVAIWVDVVVLVGGGCLITCLFLCLVCCG